MRERAVLLGTLFLICSGATGYLIYRVVGYQGMERDREIEEALLEKRGPDAKDIGPAGEPERHETPSGGVPIEEGIDVPGPEIGHIEKPEVPAEEKDPPPEDEVRILPPGRVTSDDPDRASKVAGIVLPELEPELLEKGLKAGDPVFLRVFKAERKLELWMYHRGDRRYRLFKTYPVAAMSGRLGPKLAEGDFQAPEGFYHVGRGRMNPVSNFHLAFDLGFPNNYDRAHGRTGSYLMVHGSTVSSGCFAMTDYGIEEIYSLADAALRGGMPFFRVHVFPFQMSDSAMSEAQGHKWFAFWENLRDGYAHFEERGIPPEVSVEGKTYVFSKAARPR